MHRATQNKQNHTKLLNSRISSTTSSVDYLYPHRLYRSISTYNLEPRMASHTLNFQVPADLPLATTSSTIDFSSYNGDQLIPLHYTDIRVFSFVLQTH